MKLAAVDSPCATESIDLQFNVTKCKSKKWSIYFRQRLFQKFNSCRRFSTPSGCSVNDKSVNLSPVDSQDTGESIAMWLKPTKRNALELFYFKENDGNTINE